VNESIGEWVNRKRTRNAHSKITFNLPNSCEKINKTLPLDVDDIKGAIGNRLVAIGKRSKEKARGDY
jgi:hypothetical protein